MSISNPAAGHRADAPTAYSTENTDIARAPVRRGNETKTSFKTSEFAVYVLAVMGVLLASFLVKTTNGHTDYFLADRAWFFVVLLSIGYMVSRGMAKSGIRNRDA